MEEPRKPQNAYWLYLSENRAAIQKQAGSSSVGAVGKLAGELWKKMTEAEKLPFEKKAEELKKEYDNAMSEFKAQGGEPGKRKQEKKEAKQSRLMKRQRKAKDVNRPKKPQTAFWLWLTDNRPALMKECGNDVTKVAKAGGERWRALSETDKAPFEAKAAALKAEHCKAMEEYKKTMGAAE